MTQPLAPPGAALDPTSIAGPPPGPATDPYGPIEAQAPLGTGPIIASFLRLMDQEAKLGPNRIIGGALQSPVGGLLTAGAGEGTRYRIMRGAQAGMAPGGDLGPAYPQPGSTGAETGPLADFYENTPLGALPFFRTASQTLADPFIGVGPVARAGEPIRNAVEGGLRLGTAGLGGAANMMNLARGGEGMADWASTLTKDARGHVITRDTAAGPTSMFTVNPQADWKAQAMSNVGSFLNEAGLGLPGNTGAFLGRMSGSMFKPATMQKIREAESGYRDLLTTIQSRSDEPILDWWNKVKSFTPAQFDQMFGNMALAPQQRQLFADDLPIIKAGIGAAKAAQNAVYDLGYQLIKAQGGELPARAQELKDGWPRVITGLNQQGIDSTDKLFQAYTVRFGDRARVDLVKSDLEHFDADPLAPGSQLELTLAGTLQKMRKGVADVPELPAPLRPLGAAVQWANDIQKGQAVASGVYLANNMFQRVFALTLKGMAPMDAMMNQFKGLARGQSFARGALDNLEQDQKRLVLFPKDVIDWTEHMGLNYPAIMEPGNMSNVMSMQPAADELTKIPPMAIQKIGPLYPMFLTGLGAWQGFFHGGPLGAVVGGAEGALQGKLAQMISPFIKSVERVTETFGRSKIWHNETARYAHEAMTSGVGQSDPFIHTVMDAIEHSFDTPFETLENPGIAGQGLAPMSQDEAVAGGLRDAFRQMKENTLGTRSRMDEAIHAFLGEHSDLTSASGTPYWRVSPPTGPINLTPVPQKVHRLPTPEGAQAIREFLESSGGQVSAKDVQKTLTEFAPGLGKGKINALASQWDGILQDASASGTKVASHEMIIPRTTNADEYVKYGLLFHYWATRAVPWWAEQMLSSPQYTAIVMRQMANSAKEIAYRGLPNGLAGAAALIYPQTTAFGAFINAVYGQGTLYWNLDNPFGGAPSELVQQKVGAGESYNAAADTLKLAAAMGLKPNATADWLLHIMGLYGPEAPSPDFFRYGPLFKNLPGVLGQDINEPGRYALNAMRRSLSPYMVQDPGEETDFLIRERIREIAQKQGLDPHTPQVELASADPNSALYQQAREDVRREGLAQALSSLFVGPGTGTFMRSDTLKNRQNEEMIKSRQGIRSDLGSMFEVPLAAREPSMNTYRGLSYSRPPVPELQNIIGNGFQPQQQDPRTISNNYLTWAEQKGIPVNERWNRMNIQQYYQETSMNRRISDIIRSGGQIPLGIPTGPGR